MLQVMALISLILLTSSYGWPHQLNGYVAQQAENTCHPKGAVTYCPPLDVALRVVSSLNQSSCLKELKTLHPNKESVLNCFSEAKMKNYFQQLLLMDVPQSCLASKLADCMETEKTVNCGRESCGYLGTFLGYLKESGFENLFSDADGEAACQAMFK